MKSEFSSIQKIDKIQEKPRNMLFDKRIKKNKSSGLQERLVGMRKRSLCLLYGMVLFWCRHTHAHTHTHTHTHTPHNKGKQKGMISSFTRYINTLAGKIKLFSSRTHFVNVPEGLWPEAQGSTCHDRNGIICASVIVNRCGMPTE